MALRIPLWSLLTDDRFYIEEIELEGLSYRFRFQYNERADSWSFSIGTLDEWIVEGERLCADMNPLKRVVSELLPSGSFRSVDFSLDGRDPGANDPGQDFELHFVQNSEISDVTIDEITVYVS